jgi:hypothetical protein
MEIARFLWRQSDSKDRSVSNAPTLDYPVRPIPLLLFVGVHIRNFKKSCYTHSGVPSPFHFLPIKAVGNLDPTGSLQIPAGCLVLGSAENGYGIRWVHAQKVCTQELATN